MTSASLALIVIPIVATASLVVWLIMVFSADGYPGQTDRNPVGRQASVPGKTAERLPAATATASRLIEAVATGAAAGSSASPRDPGVRSPLAR